MLGGTINYKWNIAFVAPQTGDEINSWQSRKSITHSLQFSLRRQTMQLFIGFVSWSGKICLGEVIFLIWELLLRKEGVAVDVSHS